MTLKLFISYSHDDNAWTHELWRNITHQLHYHSFIDETIAIGQNWWQTICLNIETCDIFLYIMTPKSIESIYCTAELQYAINLNKPILPIMLKQCEFPNMLRSRQVHYQRIMIGMTMDKVLLNIMQGIVAILQLTYEPQNVSRPSVPRPALRDVEETFKVANTVASNGDYMRAEEMYNQVIAVDPRGLGKIAREEIGKLKAYQHIKHLLQDAEKFEEARVAWYEFVRNYSDYDPENFKDKIDKQEKQNLSSKPSKSSSQEYLPKPFDWLEIAGASGIFYAFSDGNDIYMDMPNESYWISKYPITNGQYAKFIAAGGYRTIAWWSDVLDGWDIAGDEGWIEPLFWKNRNFNTKTQPVVDISWYEAMAFCAWLSDKTGEEITLPTEAQWQYASQGGDERAYPWGDEWHDTMCCHSHNSNGRTTSVTQYNNVASEHPFGVADMIGNVWEWTLTQRTPARPDRICRGGCWEIYSLNTFRCDHRPGYGTHPKTRTSSRGFRIVRNG